MTDRPRRRWTRVLWFLDGELPASPAAPEDENEAAEEVKRRLRLKLHLLGKRGKGGYR